MSDRTVMELAGSLRAVVAGVDLADAASFLEELAQGLASRNVRILQCGGPR